MNFWHNRRIVVTGGSGFLGSALVNRLRNSKCRDVFVPRSRDYDLRDSRAVEKMLNDLQPDLLFHLAATAGGIGANRANPGTFFYDNAIMGIHVLEEARKFTVEKTLVVGSICSYPKILPVPFLECDLWNGYPEETNAPYGLAKKMLLVQAQAYRQQYGMNVVYVMPVNLYGPRDNFDIETSHVIPAIISKMVSARENNQDHVTLWGTGQSTREFLYVEDATEAIMAAMERYDKNLPVNLGAGEELSIYELAQIIQNIIGFNGSIRWDKSKPDGQPRRKLDTTRALNEFGFISKTSLREGLKKTVQWYEQNLSGTTHGH